MRPEVPLTSISKTAAERIARISRDKAGQLESPVCALTDAVSPIGLTEDVEAAREMAQY